MVDGERPLKASLIKILSPPRKFRTMSLSDLFGYFKDLPEKTNIITDLIPLQPE